MLKVPLFVKLGGSVLTDKTQPEAVNRAALKATAAVLADFVRERPAPLLLGHGGGSFGHHWAERFGTHNGIKDAAGWHGFALVTDAMGRLNRLVVQALLEAGVSAIGVQPSASALAAGGALQQLHLDTMSRMLEVGLVPVVCGDAVLDQHQGAAIASTETVFAYLAPRFKPQRIVLLGEAAIFTADPRRNASAERIPLVTTQNIAAVLAQVGGSHGIDVTGGMATKVQAMWQLVQDVPGLEIQMIGVEPDHVRRALRGEPIDAGTLIRA